MEKSLTKQRRNEMSGRNPFSAVIVGHCTSEHRERPLLSLDHWVSDGNEGLLVTPLFCESFEQVKRPESSLGTIFGHNNNIIVFEIHDGGKIKYRLFRPGDTTPYEEGVVSHGEQYLEDAIFGRFFRSIVGD
jgi:hypothetical protein